MQLCSRRVAVLLLALICSCKKIEETTDTAATDTPPLAAASITVLADDGSTVTLTPDDNTVIAQIATWCPYSKQYVEFLRDPDAQALWQGKQFVFLLEQSEWPTVKKHLAEQMENATPEEIDRQLEQLQDDAGHAPVFAPATLESLPGKYYFLPPDSKIAGTSFPEAYDPIAGKCNKHPVLVIKNFVSSEETLARIWKRHSPDEAS